MINYLCDLISYKKHQAQLQSKFADLDEQAWESLFNIADQHGLTEVVYEAIHLIGIEKLLPDKLFNTIRQKTFQNFARNMLLLNQAKRLLINFSEAGIESIALKGIYLLDNIYKNASLREISDIDIIVRKDQLSLAINICGEMGYELTTYFDITDDNLDIKHVPPLKKADGAFLEIHWTILEEEEPFLIDIDGIWQRAIPVKIADVDGLALCAEDLLLHLCIHFAYQHHLDIGLRGLIDLAKVIEEKDIEWVVFTRRAREWGVQKVVALSLKLLEDVLGFRISNEIYPQLLNEPLPNEIIDEAKNVLLRTNQDNYFLTPDLAELSTQKSFFKKSRIFFSRIFLPKRIIARIYNRNPKSIFIYFYYPVRFWDLSRNYAASVWGLFIGEKKMIDGVAHIQTKYRLKEWLKIQDH